MLLTREEQDNMSLQEKHDLEVFFEKARDQFIRENLMSDEFLNFMQENQRPWQQLMAYYRCAIMEVETKFRVLNEQFSLQYDRNPIESIKSRIKSVDSIVRKVRNKHIPITMESIQENIRDIAGVRIVCSFHDDIYRLADCLLQQDDISLVERKDYILNPKESGYRSLHLIVQVPIFLENEKRLMYVEVQLRTIAMDFWASLEHKLRYKKDIPEEQMEELSKRLYNCAQKSAELDREMMDIRKCIAEYAGNNEKNSQEQSIGTDYIIDKIKSRLTLPGIEQNQRK
jgi:putative GTP pyrophosphokinase